MSLLTPILSSGMTWWLFKLQNKGIHVLADISKDGKLMSFDDINKTFRFSRGIFKYTINCTAVVRGMSSSPNGFSICQLRSY